MCLQWLLLLSDLNWHWSARLCIVYPMTCCTQAAPVTCQQLLALFKCFLCDFTCCALTTYLTRPAKGCVPMLHLRIMCSDYSTALYISQQSTLRMHIETQAIMNIHNHCLMSTPPGIPSCILIDIQICFRFRAVLSTEQSLTYLCVHQAIPLVPGCTDS